MASFRKLPSGKWQAIVKHPSGKRYTRTDPLKKVVQLWAQRLEHDIRRGDFIDPDEGKLTLETWWKIWLSTRAVAKATTSKNETHWRVHVQPAFGTWPIATITQLDVRQWVARMVKAGTGGEATATALRLLRQLLEAAVEAKRIRTNPAEGVKAPRVAKHVDRVFSIEEADLLLSSITKPDMTAKVPLGQPYPRVPDLENRLFVKLMLDTGVRWQEAAGLHDFRVDVRRMRARVQEVVERDGTIKDQPKSEAGQRWVPLTEELVELYLAHMKGRARGGLVFPGKDGRPLDYANWLKRVWKPAIAAAGLADPQPTPHDCRHSYGSWLADDGVPAHEIAALMGHASLRAVERYIHASDARMERARAALGARRAHGVESQRKKAPSPRKGNGA